MIRIGVDVGGTNTDAVILRGTEFVAGAKSPTTADILSGVQAAITAAFDGAPVRFDEVEAIMVGTTHFVNAIVERRALARTGLVRICLPSGSSVLPFADWPEALISAMGGHYELVPGGFEMNGDEIAPFDSAATLAAAARLRDAGCTEIALSAVFSTVRSDHEEAAATLIGEKFPELGLTKSRDIGRIGLLSRENAGLMNAAIRPLARDVVAAFGQMRKALGLSCPLYFTRNDGTIIAAEEMARLPVLTFACGPVNSMRGAAFLSGLDKALVVDVGGTTTDVGEIRDGFPRLAGVSVTVADVQTSFPMPDVMSIGLGGGTRIRPESGAIGPDSVGRALQREAIVFGGQTLTASDLAVAVGRAQMGHHPPPDLPGLDRLLDKIDARIADAVARIRTDSEQTPVLAVGGGSVILADTIDGLEVIRPAHHDLANAVGAAIAQVSGEVSKVLQIGEELSREAALEAVTQEARTAAIARGADPASLAVLSISDVPLAYLPGNNLAITVTVVGDLQTQERRKIRPGERA